MLRATAPDGRMVVLKVAPATLLKQARARHEGAVLASLSAVCGVVRLLGVVEDAGRFSLVLEDAGPWSLKQVLRERGALPLEQALRLAHQLASTLDGVHRAGVLHKDVKPQNIVLDEAVTTATLVDFGLASRLPFEATNALIPEALEGTLAYISPEQTGRTGRSVDARTDLYSLGATLFEMLSGRRTFGSNDPLTLVHAHLAVPPPSLDAVVPGIPNPVSAMVARLLAKTQELRYQTAYGLAFDLERALAALHRTGRIAELTLGEKDFSPRLLLPEKLVGRKLELARLAAAFERAAEGRVEVLLVEGPSGIGKTALVRSMYREIAEHRSGMLLAGKHDQLGRSTPYAALAQAFGGLMSEVAASSKEAFEGWRKRLTNALGSAKRVIADIVPELEWVLGKLSPLAEVPAEMAYNRIKLGWIELVRAVTDASPPLVLFLDDLQWADAASLELLKLVLTDVGRGRLLVIGAYRDNEVDAAHPLRSLITAVEKTGVAVSRLRVGPLDEARVEEWLAVALSATAKRVTPLARSLHRKTAGNPFFLGELLVDLAHRKVVRRDLATGVWEWDQVAVDQAGVTDNVVALMRERVADLPLGTQDLLGQAACAGHAFALSELCVLTGWNAARTTAALWPALVAGLVVPNDGHYRDAQVLAGQVSDASLEARYHFLHDRVQQGFHEHIAPELRAMTHLTIGRRLRQAYARGGGSDQKVLELVRHLAEGAPAMVDEGERRELARLELVATRAAKRAGSHLLAATLADQASGRLGEAPWRDEPQLAFDLALERIEAAYMLREFDDVQLRAEALLARSPPPLERLSAQELRVRAALAAGQYAAAEQLGLSALAEQGLRFPEAEEERMALALASHGWLDAWLDGHPDGLSALAEDHSVEHKIRDTIMSILGTGAAIGGRAALAAMVLMGAMRHSIETGKITAPAAYFAMTVGAMGAAITGGYREALRWAREGERAAERLGSPFLPECRAIAANYSMHELPAESAREGLRSALAVALASGSFQGTSWALALELSYLDTWAGRPLRDVAAREAAGRPLMIRVGDAFGRHVFELTKGYADFLLSGDPMPGADQVWLPMGSAHFTAQLDGTTAELARVAEAHLFLIAGEHERALERAEEAEQHRPAIHANPPVTDIPVWRGLAAARCASEGPTAAHLSTLVECITRVRVFSDGCTENFHHKLRLLEAEQARVTGRTAMAMIAYEEAIEEARAQGFLHIEALAAQLCAEFHLDAKRRTSAALYFARAIDAYTRWDAPRAAAHLRARHADLLPVGGMAPAVAGPGTGATTENSGSRGSQSGVGLVDLDSANRAAHALAMELSRDRVVARLMELVSKHAGAQRAALLLGAAEGLEVAARFDVTRAEPIRTGPPTGAEVSLAMVDLVVRSRQPLVLADARRDPRFASDARVVGAEVRSALVAPLVYRDRVVGVLYLEHQESHAFTAQRVALVGALASHSAIAIENARHHAAQAARVEQLERQVNDAQHALGELEGRSRREVADAADQLRALLPAPIDEARGAIGVHWRFVPSAELGGDAFDYLWLDRERFALSVIDGRGQGVGAAMRAIAALRGVRAADLSDPAAVCRSAGELSMWVGLYDTRLRRLRHAGHGGVTALLVEPSAHVIELATGVEAVSEQPLAPGSRLYVMTDGVHRLLGDKLRAELVARRTLPRGEALDRLLAVAREARGGRGSAGDLTVLAIDIG